jgi:hypothetical protein
MTTAQFSSYKALIIGDPTCSETVPTAAVASASAWGPAVTGNTIIIGTDPVFHGKTQFVNQAVDFVLASESGQVGAYLDLSCNYDNQPTSTDAAMLDGLRGAGAFTVHTASCYNDAHIVATHPAFTGLTDSYMSGWSCSVHEVIDTWPADFQVLAIAKDLNSTFTASDGTVGAPYVIASGSGLRSFPLSVSPTSGTAAVGTGYSVTATLLDASTHAPAPGVLLQAAAGAASGLSVGTTLACSTSLCKTDANGQVTFSYISTSPGDQVITVWVDANANGRIDVGEPQVRSAVTWTRSRSTTWLALGDSYSAGVGIAGPPDDPNNPNCMQHSDSSYSGQARTTEASAGHTIAFKFAACAGAVTADILSSSQRGTTQFPQIQYVTANTPDLVTLTVGGNDMGVAPLQ